MHTSGKLSSFTFLLSLTMPVSANVLVSSPANNSTVTLPVHYAATASTTTCSRGVASMGVYVDDTLIYVEDGANLSARLTLAAGKHQTVIEEWDRCGKASFTKLYIDVSAASLPVASTPTFSVPPGAYSSEQFVTLSDSTRGSAIHYTTDGTAPTASASLYTKPIAVSATETVLAIAVASGYTNSGMGRADYVISLPVTGPFVPANAISASQIQRLANWKFNHDPGTPGNSDGAMKLVSDPSESGTSAEFNTSFSDWGGEIYSKSYANDTVSMNFVYDAEVWIAPGSTIGNLEMDMNQVIANGDTVMYGFQCDGDHGTWDFSNNTGALGVSHITWRHSQAPCNPAHWATNTWHHVQISYARDETGNVTYNGVWLDGVEAHLGITVPSAENLHWGRGVLLTNFQIDGSGSSGSSLLYLDNLTIYRW